MMAMAKVTFPKPGMGISPNYLPVGGLATIGLTLRGVLIGSHGTRVVGNTVRQPTKQRQWMMIFKTIMPKEGETFRLEIWEDRPEVKLLADVDCLSIQQPVLGAGISYPPANSNQCKDNVMAFGTLTPPDTSLASATLGTYPADYIHSDPETGSWAAQFGVPTDTYTLSIEGDQGGTDSRAGLNCQEQYC